MNLEQKCCPYLPPIPHINRVSGTVESFAYQCCLEERCAVYESCQGTCRPRLLWTRFFSLAYRALRMLAEVFGLCESMPMVGSVCKVISERLHKFADDLESEGAKGTV
jgi:hypothetical protein